MTAKKRQRRGPARRKLYSGRQGKLNSLRLMCESLEGRLLLTGDVFHGGDAFLQGTAFYDGSNLPKINATIQLQSSADSYASTITALTDASGHYHFDGLLRGETYHIIEPNSVSYSSIGTQILSQLYQATQVSLNTIEVTIPSNDSLWLTYNGPVRPNSPPPPSFNNAVEAISSSLFNGPPKVGNAAQLTEQLGTVQFGNDVNAGFQSLCVDVAASITTGNSFQVITKSTTAITDGTSQISADHAGRIAYLFNHYGSVLLTQNAGGLTQNSLPGTNLNPAGPQLAAGLQLAVWELIYDPTAPSYVATTADLESGNFKILGPGTTNTTAAELAEIKNSATNFLNESIGKSELAIYLDPRSFTQIPQGQGMLALGSFDFRNVSNSPIAPTAKIEISPDDVNKVGDPHTFTTTVMVDDGYPAGMLGADNVNGYRPATDAEITTLSISLSGSNGAVPSPGGASSGDNNLSATFTSLSTGIVYGHAAADLSVTVGGTTYPLSVQTDGQTEDAATPSSRDAIKTFVNAKIEIDSDSTNLVGDPHVFTVTVKEDAGNGQGFQPAAGETVHASLVLGSVGTITGGTCVGVGATTNASGQCTVIVNSAVAGFANVHVSSSVSVGGINVLAQTTAHDGATTTDDARKTWILPAAIGDFVWNDLNANGVQDSGEPGIPGVGVRLYDAGNSLVGSINTDANGYYLFDGLFPGNYHVEFDAVFGYIRSPQDVGGNTFASDQVDSDANAGGVAAVTTLTAGETDVAWDAGYYRLVSVGDFVWNDSNANGIQDGTESGINGVTLTLTGTTGSGGSVTLTTTTAGNGGYLFSNLTPGTYTVTVDAGNFTGAGALVNYFASPTGQGGNPALDSNPSPTGTTPAALPGGSSDLTLDFGYFKPVTVGNFVWEDKNANGVQDSGEPGILGVTLTLTGTTGSGVSITQTTTTDANGFYGFTEPPGTYSVSVTNPAGYTPTVTGQGTTATDSNPSPSGTTPGTLASGGSDQTLDFGYFKPVTIGNFVWNDLNGSGVQDSGEPGISGVTLTLTGTTGSGVSITQATTTDANGLYGFTEPPGTYTVSVTNPAGYTPTVTGQGTAATDSNPSPAATTPGALASGGSDQTLDFGYYKLGSISGTKFVVSEAPGLSGRMTGGGSVFATAADAANSDLRYGLGTRVTHGFEIHCDPTIVPNNLEINWLGKTVENNFHLTTVNKAICLETDLQQKPPAAPFDTYFGIGTGTLNGVGGYTINWTFTDAGEPGNKDTARYLVWKDTNTDGIANDGTTVLSIGPQQITSNGTPIPSLSPTLTFGNQQAHAENKTGTGTSTTSVPIPGAGFTIHLFATTGIDGPEIAGTDRHTVTDTNGNYSFSGVAPGTYAVCEENLPGYTQVSPVSGYNCTAHDVLGTGDTMGPNGYNVTMTSGATVVHEDFVNQQETRLDGRMTGGGSIFTGPGNIMNNSDAGLGSRITHGFEIHCNTDIVPQRVEVNWIDQATGKESHFHLLNMTRATCFDTAIIQAPPVAPIDTYIGVGNGRFTGLVNGVQYRNDTGFGINFTFTDGGPTRGEPGTYDTAQYLIFKDLNGDGVQQANGADGIPGNADDEIPVLKAGPTPLTKGNHQAHVEHKHVSLSLRKVDSDISNTFGALDGTDQSTATINTLTDRLLALFDQEVSLETNNPPGLAGYVYADDNNNGVFDAGETPLSGVTLSLLRTDIAGIGQTNYGTTTTAADGSYAFINLPTGATWKITEAQPSGYLDGKDTAGTLAGTAANDVISNIVVNGTDGLNYNFGERTPAILSGYVYKDVDDDGVQDNGEPGVADATLTLTGTATINGQTVTKAAITNSSGYYVFAGLEPGTYKVAAAQPGGTADGKDSVGTVSGVANGTLGADFVSNIVLKSGSAGVNYNFGELGIYSGQIAMIGFWHNAVGQGLIKSFGTTSSGATLANTLAINLPNLFGKNAPAFNASSKVGTNLTNRSNTDVANYFLSLYGTNGQNAYAQLLATALSIFTTTNSLNTGKLPSGYTGTDSRTLATSYSFTLSNIGAGVATYVVPSVNWAAFGLTSATSSQGLNNLTLLANKYAAKGILNGGNTTQLGQTNDVFTNINNLGNIGFGLTQVIVGSSLASTAPLGKVYSGTYLVSIDGFDPSLGIAQRARIQDAIRQINVVLGGFGVKVVEVSSNSTTAADLKIHLRDTSPIGGVAQGVLGYAGLAGEITIVSGWNWYLGSDPFKVGAKQYDFQTVVTHELLHGIGLGEGSDPKSVMYAYLGTGQARRSLTKSEVAQIAQQAKAEAAANAAARDLVFAELASQQPKTTKKANAPK